MPIQRRQDKKGVYYQWGNHGHKYYFNPASKVSTLSAHQRAYLQAKAAFANGYRGH